MSTTLLLSVAVAAIVLRLLSSFVRSIYHAYKARQLGCGSAPLYHGGDPWGICNLRESVKADKAKQVLKMMEGRVQRVSDQEGRPVTTFRLRQMGREMVSTSEPKNIQAVLATQFKDFELGSGRKTSMHPLLGSGIVSIPLDRDRVGNRADWCSSRRMARNGRILEA